MHEIAKIFFLNVKLDIVLGRFMKISFNTVLPNNGQVYVKLKQRQTNVAKNCDQQTSEVSLPLAGFYYNTFRAKPDPNLLLSQSDKLLCAYSRKPMLSPYTMRSIFAKLSKKSTAQSAVNFLKEHKKYMLDVETRIFDMFEQYGASGQTNFQDILMEKRPEALDNLRKKQKEILSSTDDYVYSLDENLAEEIIYLKDVALLKIADGSFSRHGLLNQLAELNTSPKNKEKIHEIYKKWYTLPRSYTDEDAFIVKYSGFSHEEIAQRLLNMSVATVEHIKAYAKGGEDSFRNCVLTCRLYNLDKGDMSLTEYEEYNPDIGIKKNLPKYIDSVINEISRGNHFFIQNSDYPKELRQQIIETTKWKIKTTSPVVKKQAPSSQKLTSSKKGANRYRNYRR